MQEEKEQFLAEQLEVKEVVNRELYSVIGLETQVDDRVTHQLEKLAESIQQLQQ
jgi:hypothetical protein